MIGSAPNVIEQITCAAQKSQVSSRGWILDDIVQLQQMVGESPVVCLQRKHFRMM